MLLQDRGCKERSLETMGAAVTNNATRAAQRGATSRLGVVWQLVQETLDRERCPQARDDRALAPGECGRRRLRGSVNGQLAALG